MAKKWAYYNDTDEYVCGWVRNLIRAGLICDGEVDCRSIELVQPSDLAGFKQVHMFCGIAVWSHALRLASFPDDREVWTGSCPCQPFSAAGKGGADEDAWHLWPHWLRLIAECRPSIIFGEQVSAAIRIGWLDDVFTSLEQLHYACGAIDFPACSVGAPHIRQRLYFVADADLRGSKCDQTAQGKIRRGATESSMDCATGELADPDGRNASTEGLQRSGEHRQQQEDGGAAGLAFAEGEQHDRSGNERRGRGESSDRRAVGDGGDTEQQGLQEQRSLEGIPRGPDGTEPRETVERADTPTNGFWRDADWLPCIDGKARPTERTTESRFQSMADGLAARLGYMRSGESWTLVPLIVKGQNRVGRLRAYGNAIVAPVAAEFVKAFMEVKP